jgi:subtilase family serine protease
MQKTIIQQVRNEMDNLDLSQIATDESKNEWSPNKTEINFLKTIPSFKSVNEKKNLEHVQTKIDNNVQSSCINDSQKRKRTEQDQSSLKSAKKVQKVQEQQSVKTQLAKNSFQKQEKTFTKLSVQLQQLKKRVVHDYKAS